MSTASFKKPSSLVAALLALAGGAGVVTGVALVHVPSALIVAGLGLVVLGHRWPR